ncbi:MAG: hypothetical protein ABI288_11535 [Ginsengibacter sp.]
MYYLIGGDQIIYNIKDLVSGDVKESLDLRRLKGLLNDCLTEFQNQNLVSCGWNTELVNSDVIEKRLLSNFIEPLVEGDILEAITLEMVEETIKKRNVDKIERDIKKVRDTLSRIKVQNRFLHDIINLTVNRIFFAEVENNLGGSTERALGIIWMNLPKKVGTQSIEEFIVHELTHQITFYDHLSDPFFPANIYDLPKAYAISSIRKAKRPIPLVLDSLLVTCEILDHRKFNGYKSSASAFHPSNAEMIRNAIITLNDLSKPSFLKNYFLPRGRMIINLARLKIQSHYEALSNHQKQNFPVLNSK